MQIKKLDNSTERLILIGLIISKEFIQNFQPLYTDPECLQSEWSRLIARWCLEYYDKYQKPPQRDIQRLYETSTDSMRDEDTVEMIGKFLHSISAEYERMESFNYEYVLDRAVEFLKKRSLELVAQDIQSALESGDIQVAENIVADYSKVEKALDTSIEPFKNEQAIEEVFKKHSKRLIEFPGKLGALLNSLFVEGRFVSLMAPEKTGKSYFMDELLIRGLQTGSNVCLFDAGDMTEVEKMKRYIEYSAMRPIETQDEIIYPLLDCRYNQDNTCNRKERKCNEGIYIGDDRLSPQQIPSSYISCKNCKDAFRPCSLPIVRDIPSLSPKEAKASLQKFSRRIGGKTFKLSIHANSTLTFEMIERQLDQWERTDGFVPNIVAVDYIDIMVPEKNFNDYRHSQDYLWKQARKLSQERNVLLLTATQTNQSSYYRGKKKDGEVPDSSKGVRRYHVSEDKRKLSHASAIIGLSQTPDDLKDSIIKVNVVINRHGRCNDEYCVRMAGCLFISRPYLFSY